MEILLFCITREKLLLTMWQTHRGESSGGEYYSIYTSWSGSHVSSILTNQFAVWTPMEEGGKKNVWLQMCSTVRSERPTFFRQLYIPKSSGANSCG